MTDNQAIDGAPRDASNFKLCPRCANIGRSDDCTECQGRVAWYSKPPNEAFTEWYCRNPYEELTNSTAAWMAFKAGRDHASVVVQSSMTTNQTIDGVPRRVCHACVSYPRDAYCPICGPGAQPQGKSVAIDDNVEFEKWWMSTPILRKQKIQIAQEAWFARAKLAEQPEPVAAALPERVDPDYFDSVRETGIGWNACLDELKRLNPSL